MTGVGLLGCGAIGREIAIAVCSGQVGKTRLVGLFDQDREKARALAEELGGGVPVLPEFDELLSVSDLNLVVEGASPHALRSYAEKVLSRGKDLLLLSSGALVDSHLFQRLSNLAEQNHCRLMIPSGALGGIDAIRAARSLLQEVTLITTKPPRALLGSPGFKKWESAEIREAQVVFEGSALEAVELFPANVNVAATLSLAGIGPQKTRVKVVADPKASQNIHEVVAKGEFGLLRFRMELHPHDRNPRTSYLAVLSTLETLRTACSTEPKIGT